MQSGDKEARQQEKRIKPRKGSENTRSHSDLYIKPKGHLTYINGEAFPFPVRTDSTP